MRAIPEREIEAFTKRQLVESFLLLHILLKHILAVKRQPVFLTQFPGFPESSYGFVEIAAVVVQHCQQLEAVAQVVVAVILERDLFVGAPRESS